MTAVKQTHDQPRANKALVPPAKAAPSSMLSVTVTRPSVSTRHRPGGLHSLDVRVAKQPNESKIENPC